jgi:signal transduction histidine kinase
MKPSTKLEQLACYLRGSLRRRMFSLFGAAILLTFFTFMGVMRLMDVMGTEAPWRRDFDRLQVFTGQRFEHVWDDPAAREELAASFASTLDFDVVLLDAQGQVLSTHGACERPRWTVPVVREEQALGTVRVCFERRHSGAFPWRFALPFLLASLVLWALSGKVARRLAQPLQDVARVAQEIGAGNLGSRAQLHPGQPGEVGALALVINDMAAKIEKQMADQRELLAAVSHELRTPLARIRILTELARARTQEPKNLDEIDREVQEVDALVGDLLASSRLEFTALSIRPHQAQVLALRALERASLDPQKLDAPDEPLTLEGDATLLSRALQNLVDNAQGHGGGVTRLRVLARADHVAFEVEDQGPGFVEGTQRAFEAFHHGAQDGHGTLGLGLALVQRIAHAHGGKAYAQNREGGGACVGFEVAQKARRPVSPG